MNGTEKILCLSDLCRRWRVSDDTIRREIAAGKLPYFKVRGAFRFHLRDVEDYERAVVPKGSRRAARPCRSLPGADVLLGDLSKVE